MLRVAAVDLTVLRPVVDHALRAECPHGRRRASRRERDGGCECERWERGIMGSLAEGVSRLLGRPNSTNVSIASSRCAPPRAARRRGSMVRRGPAPLIAPYRCSPGSRRPGRKRPCSSARVVGRPLDLIGGLAIALRLPPRSRRRRSLAVPALSALALGRSAVSRASSSGRGSRSLDDRADRPGTTSIGRSSISRSCAGVGAGTMRRRRGLLPDGSRS